MRWDDDPPSTPMHHFCTLCAASHMHANNGERGKGSLFLPYAPLEAVRACSQPICIVSSNLIMAARWMHQRASRPPYWHIPSSLGISTNNGLSRGN